MSSSTKHDGKAPSQGDRVRALTPFHKAKVLFLVAAFVSFVLSVALWASGQRIEAIYVGLWVPSVHSLGTLVLTGEKRQFDE